MITVGSSEAKTHLPELLERVAKGENILITRRGVPVALLTQPPREAKKDVRSVIAAMKHFRKGKTLGKDPSIRSLTEEGRRF